MIGRTFYNALMGILFCLLLPLAAAETPVFRFHSALEPSAVDPLALMESTGGILFYNLYRGLYRVTGDGSLTPELAETCVWTNSTKLVMICKLRPGIRFSNGASIEAGHFVSAWQRIADPHSGSRHAELLAHVEGYDEILSGKSPVTKLGASAKDLATIEIRLSRPDPELLYKLAAPVLTPLFNTPPTKPDDFARAITTGPYRIKSWVRQSRIDVEPNPFYFRKLARPQLQVLMVEEDITALRMFDLGKLTLLRRLAVQEIEPRRSRPEFSSIPIFRFDHIGFGPEVNSHPDLRKALSLSLNYPELTAAYKISGEIGCPPLPKNLATPYPCHRFEPKTALAAFKKLPVELRSKKLVLTFSRASGEDVDRGMEWMQNQWKKHLGLNVELRPMERAMYLKLIGKNPPALFRKTLTLDRPTCTAALENFLSSSPDNSIQLKSRKFDRMVAEIAEEPDAEMKSKLCGRALKFLIDGHYIIPLGEMYHAMLAHPKPFKGWQVTPLNQLDLTDLEIAK